MAGQTSPVNKEIPDSASIPDIQWAGQWPPEGFQARPHGFRQRFNAVLLGKKTTSLIRPVAVIPAQTNELWIADQENRNFFHVNNQVGEIPHFLESNAQSFPSLVGFCQFNSSEFLFTDSFLNKIFILQPSSRKVTVLNDSLHLEKPTGIAYSVKTGEIWVIETGAHRISVLNEKGIRIRTIGKRGKAPGEFNYPTHLWIDGNGMVYVNDAMNFRVQVFDPSGNVVSVFGEQGDASGYFSRPKGIATDSRGNIYVADALFHVIQAFNIKGKYLGSIGKQGRGEQEFWMPSGIFIDEKDRLFIADSHNSRVQMFQLIFKNEK